MNTTGNFAPELRASIEGAMLRRRRLRVASCALSHDAAGPRRLRRDLSGCPECPLTGQHEPTGRERTRKL